MMVFIKESVMQHEPSESDLLANLRLQSLSSLRQAIEQSGFVVSMTCTHPVMLHTAGLADKGKPELMVFGMPQDQANTALHLLIGFAFAGRVRLEPGPVQVEEAGLSVWLRPLRTGREKLMTLACENALGRAFPALQVVLPDALGRFEGDPECDPAIVAAQSDETLSRIERQLPTH